MMKINNCIENILDIIEILQTNYLHKIISFGIFYKRSPASYGSLASVRKAMYTNHLYSILYIVALGSFKGSGRVEAVLLPHNQTLFQLKY